MSHALRRVPYLANKHPKSVALDTFAKWSTCAFAQRAAAAFAATGGANNVLNPSHRLASRYRMAARARSPVAIKVNSWVTAGARLTIMSSASARSIR